tara:strand:- start:305 stop:439 length:135 start_codon:yes stop_codon:yes gene_type:complete
MRKSVTGHISPGAIRIIESLPRRRNMLQETGRADDFLQLKQRGV